MFLIGNKSDLADNRAVSVEDINAYSREKGMTYIECSAKDDSKIKEIFMQIAKKLMERKDMKSVTTTTTSKGKALDGKKQKK